MIVIAIIATLKFGVVSKSASTKNKERDVKWCFMFEVIINGLVGEFFCPIDVGLNGFCRVTNRDDILANRFC